MKIVYEPPIPAHDPSLYAVDALVDASAESADGYPERGFQVVRGLLDAQTVAAARDELRAMTVADDPNCGIIAFEGALQEKLRLAIPSEATPEKGQFSLGTDGTAMPDLPPSERAPLVRKFMDFTAGHPPLAAVARDPRLIAAVERVLGGPARLFQEMALLKPPGGREKPWHQDHAYFNFPLETAIVGVWIALEDVGPENGCMFVLAGGHKDGARLHFLRRDWQLCDTALDGCVRTAVPMRAGDVLLFDGKLPHGTPINRTQATRWALQFHYLPAEASPCDDAQRLAAFGGDGLGVSC